VRFVCGVLVGAVGAGIAHSAQATTELATLVGIGLTIAVWFRLTDALWDLICTVAAWALSGGVD
jgi:hypothetical protein